MGVEVVVKVSVIGVVFPIFMAKNVVKVGVIFNLMGIFSVNGDFESIVLITVIFVRIVGMLTLILAVITNSEYRFKSTVR